MKGMFLGTVLAAFLFAISSCATTTEKTLQKQGLSPLTQAELEKLYSGDAEVSGTTPQGGTASVVYTSDGKARLETPTRSFEGTWRIENGKLCTQYTGFRDGIYRCYPTYKIGENKYQNFNPDGSLVSTFSFIK